MSSQAMLMFAQRFLTTFKRTCLNGRARRAARKDAVVDQVRKVLQASDQKLILMVRG